MSITEKNKIDGMGKSKETNELVLLITDHMEWNEEYEHLIMLQEKINVYIDFIESKQYKETYTDNIFDGYVIEIHFKYDMTENALKFLDTVAGQVKKINIKIQAEIA